MTLPLFFRVFTADLLRLIIDLLRRVIESSTFSFFVSFRIGSSDGKVRSNRVIRSNLVYQYVANVES